MVQFTLLLNSQNIEAHEFEEFKHIPVHLLNATCQLPLWNVWQEKQLAAQMQWIAYIKLCNVWRLAYLQHRLAVMRSLTANINTQLECTYKHNNTSK